MSTHGFNSVNSNRLRLEMATGWPWILRAEARGAPPGARRQRILKSRALVDSLELTTKLEAHEGCVNTLSWSEDGQYCVSGSDDCQLITWNMRTLSVEKKIPTIHTNNIFGAQFVPETDGRQVISCAADGELLLHDLETDLGGAGSGTVLHSAYHFLLKMSFHPASGGNLVAVSGCDILMVDLRSNDSWIGTADEDPYPSSTSAVAFDPHSPNTLAVGLDNSPVVSLFDIRMMAQPQSGRRYGRRGRQVAQLLPEPLFGSSRLESAAVSCLEFSKERPGLLLTNYRDENLCIFDTRQLVSGSDNVDLESTRDADDGAAAEEDSGREIPTTHGIFGKYTGRKNSDTFAKDASFVLGSEWIATGGDCGHLFLWNVDTKELVRRMVADRCVVNCVAAHPSLPVLAVSGIDSDIKVIECTKSDHARPSPSKRPRRGSSRYARGESVTSISSGSGDDWDGDEIDWTDQEYLWSWAIRPRSFRERMLFNPRVSTMPEALESVRAAEAHLSAVEEHSQRGNPEHMAEQAFEALRVLRFGDVGTSLDSLRDDLEICSLTWIIEAYMAIPNWARVTAATIALLDRSRGRVGHNVISAIRAQHSDDYAYDNPDFDWVGEKAPDFLSAVRSMRTSLARGQSVEPHQDGAAAAAAAD